MPVGGGIAEDLVVLHLPDLAVLRRLPVCAVFQRGAVERSLHETRIESGRKQDHELPAVHRAQRLGQIAEHIDLRLRLPPVVGVLALLRLPCEFVIALLTFQHRLRVRGLTL